MKLIIPVFIVAMGMLVGAAIFSLFKKSIIGFKLSVLAGGLGAFVGLLVRDFMDITYGGTFWGALLAAIIGAVVLSAIANVMVRQTAR